MPTTTEEPPLAGTPTVGQVLERGRARGTVAMLGPAFVAAIAYVDPGNFSTNFSAGADYGYRLVWVVVLASLMAMPVQFLSAKVGIVTGRSLPQVCRDSFRAPVRWALWVQAEIVAIATDLAEFVGAAIGLKLLFGIPPLVAAVVTAACAFVVLALQARGYRPFERAICGMLLLVFAGFAYQLLRIGPDVGEAAGSLVPSFAGSGSVYLAAGIIGATMMPHVVYLHSALTGSRVHCRDDADRRRVLRFERWDVVVALGLAGAINVSMLLIAAKAFSGDGGLSAATLEDVHAGLGTIAGGVAALAFAVALLASGISSASVGTFAGQVVMAGFVDLRIPLFVRRTVTMIPAFCVLAFGVDATTVLNFSQVVLSFGIPFALVPLLMVTRDRSVMGGFANSRTTTAVLTSIVTVVVSLNAYLIGTSLF